MKPTVLWVVEWSGLTGRWYPLRDSVFELKQAATASMRGYRSRNTVRAFKYRVVPYVRRDER